MHILLPGDMLGNLQSLLCASSIESKLFLETGKATLSMLYLSLILIAKSFHYLAAFNHPVLPVFLILPEL